MAKYRTNSPLSNGKKFLTDGGLETTLVFENKYDLPEFAAFTLLNRPGGYQAIKNYYAPYIRIAKQNGFGFILESATWRASRIWAGKLGFDIHDLRQINQTAISMLDDLRNEYETPELPMLISGCIGPAGDGYHTEHALTISQAQAYHFEQIAAFETTSADLVSAFTINYVEEAIGITLAAKSLNMPVVISFTTETDGNLPSGQSLKDAAEQVDSVTGNYPIYYMINCAHPSHFSSSLDSGDAWTERIGAIRANASCKSHAELDEADELDAGEKFELARWYKTLSANLPGIKTLGGCCGTDHTHIEQIANEILTDKP